MRQTEKEARVDAGSPSVRTAGRPAQEGARFVCSVGRIERLPRTSLPEVALLGRSNVGKSSLVNCLAGQRHLARTGGDPGRTRTLNFYFFGEFYLVDVPGYGYARVSKVKREEWWQLLRTYFQTRENLAVILQMVDLRHSPTRDDREWAEFCRSLGRPWWVVAAKADQVAVSARPAALQRLQQALLPEGPVLVVSTRTGEGREELLRRLRERTREFVSRGRDRRLGGEPPPRRGEEAP